MEINDVFRALSENIRQETCIGIIGAGVSATVIFNKENYKGYPLSSELLKEFKCNRDYLNDIFDIGQAAFLIREYEGRTTLESLLSNIYNSKLPRSLPVYKHLVSLKLPCYISFNFDELLESELATNQQKLLRLCSNEDVTFLDKNTIPVIKPHGTISQPRSICIATDEVFSFDNRIPVISNLILSKIPGKALLALGFSFSDPDFLGLLRYLKTHLKEYMPKTYAIMLRSDKFTVKFWEKYNVEIIETDLTEFIYGLNKYVIKQTIQLEDDLEPWLRNQFFWELLEIRGKPTETQVIEALLCEIKKRLEKDQNIEILQKEVNEAITLVCKYRRNYHALKQIGNELDSMFSNCITHKSRPWTEFSKLEQRRRMMRDQINLKAHDVVGNHSKILLYSQSQRVVDLLLAIEPSLQEKINLFIGECRPKSPEQFQDSILYAHLLRNSKYKITLVPDVAIFHLLRKHQIDLVLMGAHTIYKNITTNQFEYFVNTNGSETITLIASDIKIPVNIVFENEKIITFNDIKDIEVCYDEEEDIASRVNPQLSRDSLLSEKVRCMNIGYDLVKWNPNITAVSDDK